MAVTMKNAIFWDVTACGPLRTEVLVESITSIIIGKKISELGMLAVTNYVVPTLLIVFTL
jgi:hypothetical protein